MVIFRVKGCDAIGIEACCVRRVHNGTQFQEAPRVYRMLEKSSRLALRVQT